MKSEESSSDLKIAARQHYCVFSRAAHTSRPRSQVQVRVNLVCQGPIIYSSSSERFGELETVLVYKFIVL